MSPNPRIAPLSRYWNFRYTGNVYGDLIYDNYDQGGSLGHGQGCRDPLFPNNIQVTAMSSATKRAYTRDPIGPWFRKYAGPGADGVVSFCKTHSIVKELRNAVSLAEKCFQPSAIRLEEDIDPETGDRKIVIALTVRNKPREAVLAAYRDFTQQSIKILPWPNRSAVSSDCRTTFHDIFLPLLFYTP